MADIVMGTPEGIRWATAITSAASTSFDLTSWAGRYVKIYVDQNCYFAFSSKAHDDATGPGDLQLSGNVALGARTTLSTGVNAGYKVVADDIDSGSTGVQRVVDPKYPFLLLRAKSTSTALVKIKPTSDVVL